MTFPALDTSHPPRYNNYGNKARNPSPSTTTTTSALPPFRRPQTSSNSSRSGSTSMTASAVGSQGEPAPNKSEFYISVELYLPPKSSVGLRKPAPRKRSADEARLKDKSSWLSLTNRSSVGAHWRTATCKLAEEEEGCQLNIYIEETFLYQVVYIYLLKTTDIRPADQSLFDRRDVLAIHALPGQRYATVSSNEPIYLAFSNSESMYTWLTLLRSYMVPEVYGTTIIPSEGGLYRMWRQVEVHCISARDLGQTKQLPDPNPSEARPLPPIPPDLPLSSGGSDSSPSWTVGSWDDYDVWCEIWVNSMLCARTTLKSYTHNPEWHETFLIGDLPPFDNLQITLYKEKRASSRNSPIGSVVIPLGSFQRGEYMEGWNSIVGVNANVSAAGVGVYSQVGEFRLKLKVDEEIVLPHYVYSGVLQMLKSRNYLDWMNDLGARMNLKDISTQFISVAVAMNALVESICEMTNKEVYETATIEHNILFRGNSVLTKTIEHFMAWYGKSFLESSVGGVIRRICIERISIEVDPSKAPKPTRDLERNVETLVYWCQEMWSSIYKARSECPPEMKTLFEHIRKLVERRCRETMVPADDGSQSDFPWQAVSAFIFLRFIVPAILHPSLFGLIPGLPEASVQRTLTLIAKVLQSSANLNSQTMQKEQFMRGVRDFLADSREPMIDYILVVSTSVPEKPLVPGSPDATDLDRKERSKAIDSLKFRGASMPLLNREAIPLLPHLLDVPRHLAVISSAIVRRSNEPSSKHVADSSPPDPDLDEFINKCLEIEQQALKRVSKLATHARELRKRRAATSAGAVGTTSSSQMNGIVRPWTSNDSFATTTSQRSSTATSATAQRSRKTSKQESRPSTAKAQSDPLPTFGSVASRKRPSTMQENGNVHEIPLPRPRSAGRTLSSPSTPVRGSSEKDPPPVRGVGQTPDKAKTVKSLPKPLRPILKRPSTAPSPSLVPMLPSTPDLPQMPPLHPRPGLQATGWNVISSIVSTPKKDKKRLPRYSADDSTPRYPSGPGNTDSPAGGKRKVFSFRGFLSWR